jgi:hypothetical protein
VPQSDEQHQQRGHEGSASHVTRRYEVLPHSAEVVFAEDGLESASPRSACRCSREP